MQFFMRSSLVFSATAMSEKEKIKKYMIMTKHDIRGNMLNGFILSHSSNEMTDLFVTYYRKESMSTKLMDIAVGIDQPPWIISMNSGNIRILTCFSFGILKTAWK